MSDSNVVQVLVNLKKEIAALTPGQIISIMHESTAEESYPAPTFRSYLLPSSEKTLKRLRTRRRRIRGYFSGLENVSQVALTISQHADGPATLYGIKVRISSNQALKSLDASESYIRELIAPVYRNVMGLNHAFVYLMQLMLNECRVLVYYDSLAIQDPRVIQKKNQDNPHVKLYVELLEHFPRLEFVPTVKGNLIERLRRKLEQLLSSESNEIKEGDMGEVLQNVQACRAQPPGESGNAPDSPGVSEF